MIDRHNKNGNESINILIIKILNMFTLLTVLILNIVFDYKFG